MIPLDTAVTWLFPCLLAGPAHALLPAAKKGGGFDVVRYRRRVRGAAWLLRCLCCNPNASLGGTGWLVLLWSVSGLGNEDAPTLHQAPRHAPTRTQTQPPSPHPTPAKRGPQRSRGTNAARPHSGRERGRSTCEDGPFCERRWQGRDPATLAAASVRPPPRANAPFLRSEEGADVHR